MNIYEKMLITANRLIDKYGLSVSYIQNRMPVSNQLEPWDTRGQALKYTYRNTKLLLNRDVGHNLRSLFRENQDSPPMGHEIAYIAGNVPFVPTDMDTIELPKDFPLSSALNITVQPVDGFLKVDSVQAIRPSGFAIVYMLGLKT